MQYVQRQRLTSLWSYACCFRCIPLLTNITVCMSFGSSLRKYSCWENTVAEKIQLLRKHSCWENTVVEKIQLLRSCSLCNGKFDIISTHTYQCKFSSFQFPSRHLQLLPRCGGCMFLVVGYHTSQSQTNLNTNNWLFWYTHRLLVTCWYSFIVHILAPRVTVDKRWYTCVKNGNLHYCCTLRIRCL